MIGVMMTHEEHHFLIRSLTKHLFKLLVRVLVIIKHHYGFGGCNREAAMIQISNFYHNEYRLIHYM